MLLRRSVTASALGVANLDLLRLDALVIVRSARRAFLSGLLVLARVVVFFVAAPCEVAAAGSEHDEEHGEEGRASHARGWGRRGLVLVGNLLGRFAEPADCALHGVRTRVCTALPEA
jgi:hypothetical protein